MRRIPGVAIGLWSALAAASAPAQGTLEERIARVEAGLAPHVLVGADAGTWKLRDRLAHHKVPGLAIAVINGGKLEWSKQYGVRDAKSGQAVDATTLFQVASITKPVAATVALKLAELEQRVAKPAISKDEVIRRAWKAMFGDRDDKDIRSLYVEGYFHGATVPNRITVKRPNLFRNETASGVLVFDGKRAAWVTRAPDQAGNPRGPELIEPKSWRHFEVDIALVFPAFFDHPAELKGAVKVNSSDAYELFVPLPLGGIVTYFVDARSFLVTRRLVRWDGADDTNLWENIVDGWHDADGIRFPDGYVFEGRQGREKGLYENVRFNVHPDDEVFHIPEELK